MKKSGFTPAFSLTEILTATAILSIMFTIMFGILQQTSRGWQAANRKVEAAQVARMALEQIASDLESCVAVATNNVPLPNGSFTNYAFGFVHSDNAASLPDMDNATFPLSPPNDLMFVVTPYAGSLRAGTEDLAEVGYIPVRVAQTTNGMKKGRYVLLRHFPTSPNLQTVSLLTDFLTAPASWETTPAGVNATNRLPFVDNCLRFDVRFFYSPANNPSQVLTSLTWGRPQTDGTWGPAGVHPADAPAGLPRAAEVTLCVVDDRTAERLARLAPDGLSATDLGKLGNIPDTLEEVSREDVKATLREGMTTFRRRIAFKNGQP